MKKLFRLVSPKILEVYNVQRSGKLSLLNVQEPTPKNSSKIRHLLISSGYSNWDTTQIENVAYKPKHDSNIFGSKSLLNSDDVILTEPFYNFNTQYWAQAWTSKDRLNSVWKLTSKKTIVFPEALNVSASDDNKCWQSGPLKLNTPRRLASQAYCQKQLVTKKYQIHWRDFSSHQTSNLGKVGQKIR